MKKKLLIFFTLVTLFSLVAENYISFFHNAVVMELMEKKDMEESDSEKSTEKSDTVLNEKYCYTESFALSCTISNNKCYFSYAALLPESYTSTLEIPPEYIWQHIF
jgi:hypothetical protein